MEPQKIIASINGINNRIDPKRLPIDKGAATGFAAEIVNMRVTEDGSVYRDHGNTTVLADSYHSMYSGNYNCYVGNGNRLSQFFSDNTEVQIVDSDGDDVIGLSGDHFVYEKLGKLTFFSDGFTRHGILRDGVLNVWRQQKYLVDSDRVFSGAPVPKHMALLNGRMYIVPVDEPDSIVWSERGQIGLYNRAESYRKLESKILMIAAVKDGLFVSTEERTVFLRITDPHRVVLKTVASYPVREWSLAHKREPCKNLKLELTGDCRLWGGENGACIGTDDGSFFNMTEENILLPDTCLGVGASLVVGNYYYLNI